MSCCWKEHCNCHSKCVNPCKERRELLKDCMKIDWTVPSGQTQSIFQSSGFDTVFGSGYVSYDMGDSPFIIVRFLLNGVQQGPNINVFEDSSVAFTYTRFNQVTVECPGAAGVGEACEGTLSIISRVERD